MKKEILITALLVLPIILSLILQLTMIKAQEEVPGVPSTLQPGNIEQTGEKIQDIENKLTDEEARNQYLKQEWDKILLEKKYIGPTYSFIKKALIFLNPFFKSILGVEYSFAWVFVFAIIIWVTLFLFIYPPASTIFDNKSFGLIASFAITSLIGLSGVIKKATDLLSTILTQRWLVWIALFLTILIGILIAKLGGGLKQIIEKSKEKSAKQKTKQDREVIKTSAKVEKKSLESYS